MDRTSLSACLNDEQMLDAFRAGLKLPAGWRIERVGVTRLFPNKRRRFTIEYQLALISDDGAERDVNLQGRWSQSGARRAFARTSEPPRLTSSGLLGVGFEMPALSLTVCSPDLDRKLPCLADALHPPLLAARLSGTRTADQLGLDGSLNAVTCEVVNYRRGKRCTLRYRGDTTLFAKVFRDRRGERLARLQDQMADYLESCGQNLSAARCVDYVDSMRMLVLESLEAPRSRDAEPSGVDDRVAARVLAAVHGAPIEADATHSPADELAVAGRWLETFQLLNVEGARRFGHLIERLTREWDAYDRGGATLLHRDFHAGQLIARRDGAALVDLDTLSRGDAETDIATYLSHLLLEVITSTGGRTEFGGRARAFLSAYVDAGAEVDETRLRRYAISALLRRGAIQIFRRPRGTASDRLWSAAERILDSPKSEADGWIELVASE